MTLYHDTQTCFDASLEKKAFICKIKSIFSKYESLLSFLLDTKKTADTNCCRFEGVSSYWRLFYYQQRNEISVVSVSPPPAVSLISLSRLMTLFRSVFILLRSAEGNVSFLGGGVGGWTDAEVFARGGGT